MQIHDTMGKDKFTSCKFALMRIWILFDSNFYFHWWSLLVFYFYGNAVSQDRVDDFLHLFESAVCKYRKTASFYILGMDELVSEAYGDCC